MSATPATLRPQELEPHLLAYVDDYHRRTNRRPTILAELRDETAGARPNLIYPVGPSVYVHLYTTEHGMHYHVIEPLLKPDEGKLMQRVKELIYEEASRGQQGKKHDIEAGIRKLFDLVVGARRSIVPSDRVEALRYHILRDVARFGPLEPLTLDPHIEDIQAVGTSAVHVIHKFYGMVPTNVRFEDPLVLDGYMRTLSERIGRPVSDARPIVDATLPDGSRINIVYAEDVSRKGPSFSIRRAHADPVSITQLIAWKTLSAEIAAYLWLCLENGMSVFVCGEAACGKSTTLNAILSFVNPRAKLYSAEDTPEIAPPHKVWQRLLTRESGPEEARVRMFDLLKAALRSRPNYIVVGEIRGAEGAVAFQAMQTGHPTVASFHAENKVKMIQRLTSDPINIPVTFVDNLNVAVFQQAFFRDGRLVRRVTAIDEIEGYSEFDGGVVTRPVFAYDYAADSHAFKGNNNSFILERKIAAQHGWDDPHKVYDEVAHRAAVLQAMVDRKIFGHNEVNNLLTAYFDHGDEALPFKVT